MLINNPGSDDFEAASAELLDALQQQRSDLLGGSIDIHVGIGLLAGVEADRLAAKYGKDDARVLIMRDRSEAATARVDALAVEQEIAMVRTPAAPSATGALIQGRVTDLMQRTAGMVTVQVVDEKGQAVAGIDPVDTDDAGYFAFELTPEMVKTVAQSKLSVMVRAADVRLVPAAAEPIVVAAGATQVMDVSLSGAELEKLRLRIPVASGTTVVKVATAEAAPVADRTAGTTIGDKGAAGTTAPAGARDAGDGAAAAKAAAETKAAAEKAAAEEKKAAGRKAAAEKEAEAERAAEKEKAEREKAAKAAEDEAARAKAAAEAAAAKAAEKKSSDKTVAEEKPDPGKPVTKPKGTTDKKQ